jgi:hypothetical protein
MPGTTPNGFPYPAASEPVRDGAAAIQALATAIDPRLPYRVHKIFGNYTTTAGGLATVTCPAVVQTAAVMYQGGFAVALTINAFGANDIQVTVRNMADGVPVPSTTATIVGVALLTP